jgi:hypothetical protein
LLLSQIAIVLPFIVVCVPILSYSLILTVLPKISVRLLLLVGSRSTFFVPICVSKPNNFVLDWFSAILTVLPFIVVVELSSIVVIETFAPFTFISFPVSPILILPTCNPVI